MVQSRTRNNVSKLLKFIVGKKVRIVDLSEDKNVSKLGISLAAFMIEIWQKEFTKMIMPFQNLHNYLTKAKFRKYNFWGT